MTKTTTQAAAFTPVTSIVKAPTVAQMRARIATLSQDMDYPIQYAADTAKVSFTSSAKKGVVIAILNQMESTLATRTALIQEIEALGGKATIKNTHRELVMIRSELLILKEEAEEALTKEIKVVDELFEEACAQKEEVIKTTTTQEAAPMTRGITKEELEMTMAAMMESMTTVFSDTVAKQTERMDESARYVMALEKRLEALSTPAAQVTPAPVVTPVVEVAPVVEPNRDEIVYSDDQIQALEMAKSTSMERYETMKAVFDRMNKTMGRTVGGVLDKTAIFFDEKGHKGVDSIADILDQTIESARVIATSVVNLSATTLTSANAIGRTAGHVIINGTVHTLELVSNIASKKQ